MSETLGLSHEPVPVALPFDLASAPLPGPKIDYENADEETLRWALSERLSRLVDQGGLELGFELAQPGVGQMLTALYPENPLIRAYDYEGETRKSKHPPLSGKVGRQFGAGRTTPFEAAALADEAQQAVESWYGYLLDGDPPDLRGDWHESQSDWRRIVGPLTVEGDHELLSRFARHSRSRKESAKLRAADLRDRVHSQQVMLPNALLTIAMRSFPGTMDELSDYFLSSEDERADIDDSRFSSTEASLAFKVAVSRLSSLAMPGATERVSFINELVEQSMATSFSDRARNRVFGVSETGAREHARIKTQELGESLGLSPRQIRKAYEAFDEQYRGAQRDAEGLPQDRAEAILKRFFDRTLESRTDCLINLQCVLQARALAGGLFERRFKPGQLDTLLNIAKQAPLGARADRVREVNQLFEEWEVEWIIVPPHKGLRGPRDAEVSGPEQTKRVAPPRERVDESREEDLRSFILEWGGGAMVRSKLPNLPRSQQYLVALLPLLLPSGEMVWHGIADNKNDPGDHAVYVWRAETGVDQLGQIRRTWDQLFRLRKDELVLAGAYRKLHTPTLWPRIRELIYGSAERVKRYEDTLIGTVAVDATIELQDD